MKKIYGDSLVGRGWDRVRKARQKITGHRGGLLDDELVPQDLRPLLPYASLLATGEEGLREEFRQILEPDARERFIRAFDAQLVRAIEDFAHEHLDTAEGAAFLHLIETYFWFDLKE